MITAADENAIRQVPAAAWKPGTCQDGTDLRDADPDTLRYGATAAWSGWLTGSRGYRRGRSPAACRRYRALCLPRRPG